MRSFHGVDYDILHTSSRPHTELTPGQSVRRRSCFTHLIFVCTSSRVILSRNQEAQSPSPVLSCQMRMKLSGPSEVLVDSRKWRRAPRPITWRQKATSETKAQGRQGACYKGQDGAAACCSVELHLCHLNCTSWTLTTLLVSVPMPTLLHRCTVSPSILTALIEPQTVI